MIKKIVLTLILLITIIILYFQYRAESYLTKQKAMGVYLNEERRKWKPFILFIAESNLFNQHSECWGQRMFEPYKAIGLDSNYVITPMYSAYIVYCYDS